MVTTTRNLICKEKEGKCPLFLLSPRNGGWKLGQPVLGEKDVLHFPRRPLGHDRVENSSKVADLDIYGIGGEPGCLLRDEAVQHDRTRQAIRAAVGNGSCDA